MSKNCISIATINGKEVVFKSDAELDAFLLSQLHNYQIDEIHKTFAFDPQAGTLDILHNKIMFDTSKSKYKAAEVKIDSGDETFDIELSDSIPRSISVTKLVTEYGHPDNWNEPISAPFNVDQWKRNYITKEVANGISESIAREKADLIIKSWEELTKYGSEVHKLFESVINNTHYGGIIDVAQQQYLTNWLNNFIDNFKKQFGQNSKFYTEVPIRSRDIAPSLRSALGDIDFITGRVDFLAIDADGRAHIFDFKVSKKGVGIWEEMDNKEINKPENQWWHSTKKRLISYQMGYYRRMFEQYGITVFRTGIIPVKLDLKYATDDISIEGLNNVEIPNNEDIDKLQSVESKLPRIWPNITEMLKITTPKSGNFIEMLQQVNELHNKLFPNNSNTQRVKNLDSTFNYYKNNKAGKMWHELLSSNPEYKLGNRYVLWITEGTVKKPIYTKTEAELDDKIKEFIKKQNEASESEYITLAKRIQSTLKGEQQPGQLLDKADTDKSVQWLNLKLWKYLNNNWEFVYDESLNQEGIFIFKKWGQAEIVMLTNNYIHSEVDLGFGVSIIGAFKKDGEVDFRQYLRATNGNLAVMKAMSLIHLNPEIFQGYRINSIHAINYNHQSSTHDVLNSQLIANYRDLISQWGLQYNHEYERYFADDISSSINLANSYVDMGLNFPFQSIELNPVYDAVTFLEASTRLEKLIKDVRSRLYSQGNYNLIKNVNPENLKNPEVMLYNYLNRAYITLHGYQFHDEADKPMWFRGIWPMGLMNTSPAFSASANVRERSLIIDRYTNDIREQVAKYQSKFREKFKSFYNLYNSPHIVGGEANYFLKWFVKDPHTGQIDQRFLIKSPDDPIFSDPVEKEAVKTFLQIVNELQYRGNEAKMEEDKDDLNSKYYQVPLLEALFNRQIRANIREKGLLYGVTSTISNKTREKTNLFQNILADQIAEKQQFEKEELQVFNRFNIQPHQRSEMITKYGIAAFETDLERVMREVIVQYARENASKHYVPLLQALNVVRNGNLLIGANETEITDDYIDKMIRVIIYGDPIIDKSLQPIHKILMAMKSFTSNITLGFNLRSGTREALQGAHIGFNRSYTHLKRVFGEQLSEFSSATNYTKAFMYVGADIRNQVNDITMLERMNLIYGMANSSMHELPQIMRNNQLGVANWGSDQLHFFNKAPDYLHRMSFLVAKMMHEGCWEAHEYVSKEEPLRYNFNKDKRYEIYISGDKSNPEYLKQYAKYLANLEQFNKEGHSIKEGDSLPRAYTVLEASGIKNFADMCYGHYDKESKALINSTFLGSMIMQFKTFVVGKFEQWMIQPGTYNMYRPQQQYNANGEKLYKLYTWTNPEKIGKPHIDYITESEIKPEHEGRYIPYYNFDSLPIEGMVHSMISYIKALSKMDAAELKKLWENDLTRANFISFLYDLPLMILLQMLIMSLFNWDTLKDESWIKNWSAMVLYGATQDGPINNIIASMVGDLNPPVKTQFEKLFSTAGDVITGDRNIWNATLYNIGALRELHTVTFR